MLHVTGQVIHNRYRILNLLGQGGFGAVYRAWDTQLHLACAIKQNSATSAQAARQFAREASILAKLRHPNLPRVLDYFSLPMLGQYLVMEYIDGEDLQVKLDKVDGPLPEARVVAWADQVLDALEYLHHQEPPIVHRDIKPANIRITPQGQAVLVDFGIAIFQDLTEKASEGVSVVTPGYSPYEQYSRGNTDTRTDIYALGATVYTLLTGDVLHESVLRVVNDPVRPASELNPALSSGTSQVIQRAIQVDPRKRWQTAAAFKAALHGQAPPETQADLAAAPTDPFQWPAGQDPPETLVLPDALVAASRSSLAGLRLFWGIVAVTVFIAASLLIGLIFIDPFGWLTDEPPTKSALVSSILATRTAAALESAASGGVAVDTLTAIPHQDRETLRIGMLAPMSGSLPSSGISMKQGADLAVKEWNARGGVLGKKIELVILDSRCEAGPAMDAAYQLIFAEEVRYLVGEICSRASIPAAEIANQNGVVMVSPVSAKPSVTVDENGETRSYVYRLSFIDSYQGKVMAKFAISQGYRTAFTLYNPADLYSSGLKEAFEKTFTALGGRIVGQESYSPTTTDFSAILSQVNASQADVLFVPDYPTIVNLVGRQAKAMGLSAVLMGGDGWDSPEIDPGALDGGFFINSFDMVDTRPILVEWLKKFGREYNYKNPDGVSALTYDSVNLLLAALEQAGVDDPARVAETMAGMTWNGVTGTFYFDAQHNPIKSASVLTFHQGKKVYVTTVGP